MWGVVYANDSTYEKLQFNTPGVPFVSQPTRHGGIFYVMQMYCCDGWINRAYICIYNLQVIAFNRLVLFSGRKEKFSAPSNIYSNDT